VKLPLTNRTTGWVASRRSTRNLATRPFEIKSLAASEMNSNSSAESIVVNDSGSSATAWGGGASATDASARRNRRAAGIHGMKPSVSEERSSRFGRVRAPLEFIRNLLGLL